MVTPVTAPLIRELRSGFCIAQGDLELRSGSAGILAEVVRWQDPQTCYTLAVWRDSGAGPDLTFLGDRPFAPAVDPLALWSLLSTGQALLDGRRTTEDLSIDLDQLDAQLDAS